MVLTYINTTIKTQHILELSNTITKNDTRLNKIQ